ncbi:hypothetical protein HN604_01240 [archaeon]|jgi:hypothetical protein|nr:hypothetical protein [archaeon]MBT6606758.1 hypothetical protein [archaeon]MBT7251769.1 hypothetical protein [archaeon]MBT7660688.1 hypothetical protein [archaeon]
MTIHLSAEELNRQSSEEHEGFVTSPELDFSATPEEEIRECYDDRAFSKEWETLDHEAEGDSYFDELALQKGAAAAALPLEIAEVESISLQDID